MPSRSDEDWLNENLLDDGYSASLPTRSSADLPRQLDPHDPADFLRQLDPHDQGPYRLVIAIDYGTTFTGKQSLVAIFGVS